MLKPYELEAMAVTVFELPLSQWLLKIVLSIFFITGYNSVYVVLWHHANNKAADNSPHTFWYRLSVTVFCLLASLFFVCGSVSRKRTNAYSQHGAVHADAAAACYRYPILGISDTIGWITDFPGCHPRSNCEPSVHRWSSDFPGVMLG